MGQLKKLSFAVFALLLSSVAFEATAQSVNWVDKAAKNGVQIAVSVQTWDNTFPVLVYRVNNTSGTAQEVNFKVTYKDPANGLDLVDNKQFQVNARELKVGDKNKAMIGAHGPHFVVPKAVAVDISKVHVAFE